MGRLPPPCSWKTPGSPRWERRAPEWRRSTATRIEHIATARATSAEVVINARTDSYWLGGGDYEETVRRGNAYLEAGADCVFVPLVNDAETIRRLVQDIKGPVNMLAGPEAPPIPKMQELRVAAEELRTHGTYGFAEKAIPYTEVNELLRR